MTLVHKLAFVFLFGALCWSAPTRHSRSKKQVESCSGDRWCGQDLTKSKAQKLKFHIGDTPTFMPAVKRCLLYDDLPCYKLVLEHFTKKGLVEEHHLTQMPALAAQLGASKIFRSFGKKKSDPLWYHWMTRAIVRLRFDFLQQVAGIRRPRDIERVTNWYPKPSIFYDILSNDYDFTYHVFHPSTTQSLKSSFISEFEVFYKDWIVEDMVTNQPPIWNNIFDSLKLNDKREREEALLKLKNKIVDILSEGVYVIDDIMLSPLNIHALWKKYVTPQGDEPDDRSDFVMWLIREGSPVSDMVLLELLTWRPELKSQFEPELQMAVKYASGSGTASLVNQLRIYIQEIKLPLKRIVDVLPAYKEVLHANFSDPIVLKYANILVKTKRSDGESEKDRHAVRDFFMEQGPHSSEF